MPPSLRLLVAFVVSACLVTTSVAGERPSADQLIDLAPVIRSSDPARRSIEVSGSFKAKGVVHLTWRLLYRAPDRYALEIRDGADGTPLFFAADGKMLIYDPVRPVVLFAPGVRVNYSTKQEDGMLRHWMGFERGGEGAGEVLLDIGSLLKGPVKATEVVEIGEGMYRLTQASESGDSLLVASVDLARPCPFTRIELTSRGGGGAASVCMEKIAVDEHLDDAHFAFPARDRLAEKMDVKDWPGGGALEKLEGLALMMRSCFVRAAARNPELRDKVKFPGLTPLDWERVERNDRAFSGALREILGSPTGRPSATPDGARMVADSKD